MDSYEASLSFRALGAPVLRNLGAILIGQLLLHTDSRKQLFQGIRRTSPGNLGAILVGQLFLQTDSCKQLDQGIRPTSPAESRCHSGWPAFPKHGFMQTTVQRVLGIQVLGNLGAILVGQLFLFMDSCKHTRHAYQSWGISMPF